MRFRRKRDSKRRWKARCIIGRLIPREAIENYSLTQWFRFFYYDLLTETYTAERKADG